MKITNTMRAIAKPHLELVGIEINPTDTETGFEIDVIQKYRDANTGEVAKFANKLACNKDDPRYEKFRLNVENAIHKINFRGVAFYLHGLLGGTYGDF